MARGAFHGAAKRFGEVEAVRDLTLDVADGELMVLVGPSGSGKTTALRMLAGLEAVDAGRIEIGERVVNDVSPRDRDVAMVFQDYALYPQMTRVRQHGVRPAPPRAGARGGRPARDRDGQRARARRRCCSAARASSRAASSSASRSAARWCASRRCC